MNIRHLVFITGLMTTIFLMSCANIMAPTGGPRDETSPIVKLQSVNDSSLNFKGGKIQFEFDEFVQVKDIASQLTVTPLLKQNPVVTYHKQKVTVYLSDTLLEPNTTYNISFGKSIQDIHEGNAAKDVGITFSTGAYFDSLSVKGKVIESTTGLADTSAWVLLYPAEKSDSAFVKEKPMYIQKSNLGLFEFKNLPNRKFTIYALKDNNNNLKYDALGEHVAFYETSINPLDSTNFILLYSFEEATRIDTSKSKLLKKGLVTSSPKNAITKISYRTNIDTTKMTKRTFDINNPIELTFDQKISSFDVSKIRLFQDEILDATSSISLDSTSKVISIKTNWVQDANYSLIVFKDFVKDSLNLSNSKQDTFNFKTKRTADYGFITVICEANAENWLELLSGEKMIARLQCNDTLVTFPLLNPSSYQLRILHDRNQNGKWDTGILFEKIKPEIIELVANELTVKANWENKVDVRNKKKSLIGSKK